MTSAVHGGPATPDWTAEVRRTLRLALPMIAAYLAEIGMWWTDQAVVGRIGSDELAAVGLAGGLLFEVVVVAMGILSIVAVLVGNAHGADETAPVGRAVRQGLRVAVLLSVATMVYGWFVADLLALTGQQPAIVALARTYTRMFLPGVPAVLAFAVLRSFVAGVSRPLVVTAIAAAALPVNLGLNLLLVFGGWGLPALGVAGSALASVTVTWLMLAALVVLIVRSRALRSYRVFAAPLRHDRREWRQIWRLGLPIGALTVIEGGLFVAIAVMAGLIGTATLAANQIAGNVASFTAMLAVGLGEAAAVRVAQEIGARRPAGARAAGIVAMVLGIGTALAFALPLWLRGELAAAIFVDTSDPANAATVAITVRLCAIAAVFLVFDELQIIATRALRGLHDTTAPAWISALGYWVLGVPLAAVLAFAGGQGGAGLWWGMAAGLAVASMMLARRFLRLSRAR